MRRHNSECGVLCARAARRALVFAGMLVSVAATCRAQETADAPPQPPLRPAIRSGGVIAESYVYHRQQPTRALGTTKSIEPAGGWYGYGFPVSTFRWGWFGAAHYYPFVWWHDGYYGDCCRYAYRHGY
jgi:hypothetical protein